MKVFNSIDEFAASGNDRNIVTTGTFDGVHLGHRTILERVCNIAKTKNTESVLLTFHPHPRQVLFPAPNPQLGAKGAMFFLTTLEERKELLEKLGIQNLIIHPFTKELSQVSAEDYVKDILVSKLKTETLVIGYDHHFGKDRKGSIKELKEWGPLYNFNIEEIAPLKENDVAISSSKIRKALQGDDLQTANNYLGYHFFIHAKVIHGMKIGSTELGYPTANLEIDFENKIVPADGIYAVYVNVEGRREKEQGISKTLPLIPYSLTLHKGMMSIGMNPTIENKGRSMEVHIFDFNEDIYGKTIKVSFFKKIRNEEKFNNLAELKARLDKDKEICLEIL
jgi:riboflavin kinase / FMN adenylyltransferase